MTVGIRAGSCRDRRRGAGKGAAVAGGSKIWTVRGVPAELQTAVSAAAKSARQTLGEWTAAALTRALSGDEATLPAATDTARMDALEQRVALLERRLEGVDSRSEGTVFRVDSLERRSEGLEGKVGALGRRVDGFDLRTARMPVPAPPRATPAEDEEAPQGPFTRGIGSRKRLTAAGEEELQRLLAAGIDDAAIAARLGIHKRIVWARRLTESAE